MGSKIWELTYSEIKEEFFLTVESRKNALEEYAWVCKGVLKNGCSGNFKNP